MDKGHRDSTSEWSREINALKNMTTSTASKEIKDKSPAQKIWHRNDSLS
jgi:hypothetical protein